MKIITKTRGRFKFQVQEQSTGFVYRAFPSQAEAQKYIDHTDGVLESAAPAETILMGPGVVETRPDYIGSLAEEMDNQEFLDSPLDK